MYQLRQAFFASKKLAPPQTLMDLIKPEYKDMLVVETPPRRRQSGVPAGHCRLFGPEKYLDYWNNSRPTA